MEHPIPQALSQAEFRHEANAEQRRAQTFTAEGHAGDPQNQPHHAADIAFVHGLLNQQPVANGNAPAQGDEAQSQEGHKTQAAHWI